MAPDNITKKYLIIKIFQAIIFASVIIMAVMFFKNLDRNTISSIIGYAHTGLANSPGGQIAFEQSKTAPQYAVVIPKNAGNLAQTQSKSGYVAMGPKNPEQLFDINLELDQAIISKIEDMGLRVMFTSFGTVPTPVDMTFDILDSNGNVLHSEKASTIVETEEVYNKKINNFSLTPGNYTLRLTTLYNKNVKDEFYQPFEIILVKPPFNWVMFWLSIAAVMITLYLIFPDKISKLFIKKYGKV